MSNQWTGTGVVKRIHNGNGAKGAYSFLTVIPDDENSFIDVAAFGRVAEGLTSLAAGDRVTVVGRLGSVKDKQLTEKAKFTIWRAQIVADDDNGGSVTVEAARSAPKEDDIAF